MTTFTLITCIGIPFIVAFVFNIILFYWMRDPCIERHSIILEVVKDLTSLAEEQKAIMNKLEARVKTLEGKHTGIGRKDMPRSLIYDNISRSLWNMEIHLGKLPKRAQAIYDILETVVESKGFLIPDEDLMRWSQELKKMEEKVRREKPSIKKKN